MSYRSYKIWGKMSNGGLKSLAWPATMRLSLYNSLFGSITQINGKPVKAATFVGLLLLSLRRKGLKDLWRKHADLGEFRSRHGKKRA